ncbi:MAG: hypothetical protein L0271_26465 [Gemmatimonadetes bacterium]|nr:hypothetical protein [Gemmatimonadota bacterium]
MTETRRPRKRRVQFFLRDFRLIEAHATVPDGLTLAGWLSRKREHVAVLDARWTPTGERVAFAVIRLAQILYACAPDGDVAHVAPATTARRHVELLLEGGLFVRGTLPLSEQQRIGDYLDVAGPFLPLTDAVLMRSGRPPRDANVVWRDIALNHQAVQAIWEARDGDARAALVDPADTDGVDTGSSDGGAPA